jgi:hypothetical protein
MGSPKMYTYRLATEAWHRLLQLNGSHVIKPPSGASLIEIPAVINRLDIHCPLQSQCASLLASLMYSIAQTPLQPAVLHPL